MRVILVAHVQAPGNTLLAYGAVDLLEIGYTFAAKAALGTDAAIVLFAAIIAVLFRLQFPGAVIAVAAVAGEVSVGAARAAVVDAVRLLITVVALSGTSAAVAAAILVPMIFSAARTFHSVLIGGVAWIAISGSSESTITMLSSHDRSFFPRGELLVEQVDTSLRFRCFILFFSSFSDFGTTMKNLLSPLSEWGMAWRREFRVSA